ncbi:MULTISPECIES: glycosyltransferase family 4 protein [unclassified Halorhodospira]|uniref:glycosyltransferase family 4 protein n=1 Tax=unclassified Halorhodospira TaxID=2626748 RepID=UPI001EE85FD1|nr:MULTISPECIES: glycosyltransferase family 4 protein [unclassified Halorhodospira]MCG5540191.1 glycosyltransferase family 4 protein [Halorhodospira sp. M39old]MCG5545108.1 glycosyltransferase family 4 protein [Halorhodospira sp. M38]
MKILYHHRTRGEDAQGIHIRALCAAFRELGHQVVLVGPPRRRSAALFPPGGASPGTGVADARPSLAGLVIPHWFYELLALAYNTVAVPVLLAQALRHRPGLIYERYALFSLAGLCVARVVRRPFILEVNAPLSLELRQHGHLWLRGLAQRVEDFLCRSATRTVVVSQAMAEILKNRGIPAERLLVMPNGVDQDRFHAGVDGESVRSRLRLTGCRVVGFVGWVRRWHGVDGLMAALAPRLRRDPGLRLLVVGDGPALPDLRARARQLGVEDRVCFAGAVSQEEVPAYIAALDIAVQPAVTEYASPIKLFEYLALGCPVVAPDQANIRELIRPGVTAEVFPPGDWGVLGVRLEELLDDPQRCRQLGERGAASIPEHGYTWRANAERVLAAVEAGGSLPVTEGL